MRVDKLIVSNSSETSDEEVKDKSATLKHKLEEPVLDDLVKGIQELNLNLKAVKLEGLSSKGSTSDSKPRLPRRDCMWCDSQDHERGDYNDFNEAYRKNIVFWKDNKIHLRATGEPIRVNFGQGGMKKLAEEILHNVTMKGVCEAENCIRETTGWSDLVDLLSVYAYIAKSEANEAWVEEKRKQDEEAAESSKRATRSSNKKEEVPKPSLEVNMEDAPKDKKQDKPKGPFYKLKFDIELATDLKKVLEGRILNSKVEMTLGDILGIAKREFHEEIIDIIKRKRQIPSDQEPEGVKSQDDEEAIPRSHFTRTYWARATTETIVKLGDMDEPVLALVDHGLEINLMSKSLQQKGRWPIDVDHGWRIRAANMLPSDLYGACANVKVTIGDVCDEHNFFIQEHSSYSIILGQPYITAVRMETKVLDDGSTYARMRSRDGIQSDLQGCNVLQPDEVISGIFEEVSYVDMMSELDEINRNKLQSGTDFVKVETKYKTVAKKESKEYWAQFTEETLKQLKIDEDGFLIDEEVKCFQEMLKKHGKGFAFELGFMPFELMYGQKSIMPTEEAVLSWTILPWEENLSTEDLLALRIRQLERRQEDIKQTKEKLKVARVKNKVAFDSKHRLRPYVIKDGDWVHSSLENQYSAMRKMVKKWFGPYVVLHAYDNATYKPCELDGTELKVPIAGKRIKLFKKRDGEFVLEDLNSDQLLGNEVYASDDESDHADEAN
ncbi:hypothetical protein L7F22_021438 [Adiantum nelumboides]|nr:hypothetical protein [Adiantum nelumboides]